MKEIADEFCREVASLHDSQDGDLITFVRGLVGFPVSSADTAELIELLQAEQSLLHHCVAKNPGNPSVQELSYVNRLQTTKQLLHSLHESSLKSGFPRKGLGWRTNFVLAAQVEIDKLAEEIGSRRSAPSIGVHGYPPAPCP